jgi:hypothetical protein
MTTQNTQAIEKLLTVAGALAERQLGDFNHHLFIASANRQSEAATQEIAAAEHGIATAEAALAAARLARLVAVRRLSTTQVQLQQLSAMLDGARRQLWSVCSSPDSHLIVAAATSYGERAHSLWLVHEDMKRLRTALESADSEMARASEDLDVHKTALSLALQHQAAAAQAASAVGPLIPVGMPGGLFALEQAVTDAAHELTGTVGEEIAYSYVCTSDLPVWNDMLAAASGGEV